MKRGLANILYSFLNLPCLIAFLLCCLLMSFFWFVLWLGICAEVELDCITILPPPTHSVAFFPYPQFFLLTQVTVI